ncbi:MAG: glycosyltransferase [Planktothrix sp.]
MPLVSVVIPAYNAGKTIISTVDSVLKQTLYDFEIIVINDGSTDSTLKTLDTIKDDRLKVFSYPNAGVSVARNRGITHATGEYIAFLDADDIWVADKLEAQVKALLANPEAGLAYSWTDYIDEEGKFLYPGDRIQVNGNVYENLLVHNFVDSGSNVLIKRQALSEVGEFDSSINTAADWDMWLRLAERYDFVAVPKPQILYRISQTSMSANLDLQKEQCLKVLDKACAKLPDSLKYLKKKSLGSLYQYLMLKMLSGPTTRSNNLKAAQYFYLAITNDPHLLKQRSRLMGILFAKIVLGMVLPPKTAKLFISKLKQMVS